MIGNIFFIFCFIVVSKIVTAEDKCSSSTDVFVHRRITIPQKPLSSVVIHMYKAPQIMISCLSFKEFGPACGEDSVPVLCHRRVNATLSPFICESLSQYKSVPNGKFTRGDRNGPEMMWIIKWNPVTKGVYCFPLTLEVRLLAFVNGPHIPSTTLASIFGFIAVLCLIFILIAVFYFCRGRYNQLDTAGVTTISGPKINFRGTQPAVTDPHSLTSEINYRPKIVLPMRVGTGDLVSRYEAILNDPKTPKGAIIVDENGTVIHGVRQLPHSGFPSDKRPSPPAPGGGVDDGLLQSHKPAAQQPVGSSIRRRRHRTLGDDDDRLDDRDASSVCFRSGLQGEPQFPTQPNFSPNRGDDKESSVPDSLIAQPQDTQMPVKYIPQWMYGSFGRGGTIPEPGDSARYAGSHTPLGAHKPRLTNELRSALKKSVLRSPALPNQEENGFSISIQESDPLDKGRSDIGAPCISDSGIESNPSYTDFQRADARVRSKAIVADTVTYVKAGGILTPGRAERGGRISAPKVAGRDGGLSEGATRMWVCEDCGTSIGDTNDSVYCLVTGKRHF
eukprot:Tbor_TRINITY_DN7535_c0_g1::TRINITY_DN7535_c0_g1_i1::g.888::m.888